MPYSKSSSHSAAPLSAAERKKKLLADGALHRAKILIARTDISAGAQPRALTHEAIAHFSATAKTLLFDTVRNTAMHPGKLSPLLMTGISLLAKKSVRKPLLYAGLAGGAIAGAVYLFRLFNGGSDDTNQNEDDGH